MRKFFILALIILTFAIFSFLSPSSVKAQLTCGEQGGSCAATPPGCAGSTLSSSDCSTGSLMCCAPVPGGDPELPACNWNPHCELECVGLANTCGANNGKCAMLFDALIGTGAPCNHVVVADSNCTIYNCDADKVCPPDQVNLNTPVQCVAPIVCTSDTNADTTCKTNLCSDYTGCSSTTSCICGLGYPCSGTCNIASSTNPPLPPPDKPYPGIICAQPGPVPGTCLGVYSAVGIISTDPPGLVKYIFGVILGLAGGIALILIMLAGYGYMTSQGNPEKVKAATEQLTAAIVGLLFIIFSFVILQVIGVDILKIPGFG